MTPSEFFAAFTWRDALDFRGVGYRAEFNNGILKMTVGLSHQPEIAIPAVVSVRVEQIDMAGTKFPRVHLESVDKDLLGQVAAHIRSQRPPEPYKGKGVRYTGEKIREKAGKSGALVFVTVRHEIGREGEPPAIVDEHDIVYRGLEAAPAAPTEVVPAGAWRRTLTPDAVLLFRYSALTFNGHRIHYDRDYVTGVEGYPGLVVHGPLTATLLVDLVRRNAPAARIDSFSFRAMSPLFDGNDMSVNAALPDADGRVRLWAANAEGRLAMAAEASLSGTVPS